MATETLRAHQLAVGPLVEQGEFFMVHTIFRGFVRVGLAMLAAAAAAMVILWGVTQFLESIAASVGPP